jgi:hypothetical protein
MPGAPGSSARPPGAWGTIVATSAGRPVQRHVHDLVSSQYQRTSPHAEPPSAIMLSAGMWMPHSQHETTAGPPGPGLEPAAAGGRAGRWLRRPAGRSAAALTARSGLSRRLQPWLLLVPCQLAAADLVTGCPGRARWQVHPDRDGFDRTSERPARGDGRTCPQPLATSQVRPEPLGDDYSAVILRRGGGTGSETG